MKHHAAPVGRDAAQRPRPRRVPHMEQCVKQWEECGIEIARIDDSGAGSACARIGAESTHARA